ncbi:efflux RND transporter periplasmic adaptor subunit [Stutzerimonas degradans]|uniref:efflux RND transporter periplasmic adaptor subunit n=1 Tax=Stutzerimonas degradans TaxID=2968968 RepID=UPI0028D75667|nr:efflux RND transporter periplasmic adaptor subunit [Stutzerimonas degradans]
MSQTVLKTGVLIAVTTALGLAGGYWLASRQPHAAPQDVSASAVSERKVLYWYDPMMPQQRFDQPGKSPFMDMDLVPRYADETDAGGAPTVRIDADITHNLGVRLATVSRGQLARNIEAVGVLGLNDRDVALVQARAAGFVERVYRLAPGDVLTAGAPLVDLLIPEWVAAQEEFLALRRSGDRALLDGARQRLRLVGMPAEAIRQLERSGRVQALQTVRAPIGGVLQELDVREGMSVDAGAPLARINGLDSVWLEVAVPEAQAGGIRTGQAATAHLPALPGEPIAGTVTAVLPEATAASRTLRVRVELPNAEGRLRPGLSARVELAEQGAQSALLIPSEAVIRTGKRALVMLAEAGGRYRPVEVQLGVDNGSQTAILQGLEEGQQVVASGQFLLDSEASLRGITAVAAPPEAAHEHADAAPAEPSTHAMHEHAAPSAHSMHVAQTPIVAALHETEGRIVEITEQGVKIAHGPFKTLGMPGMTMRFPVKDAHLLHGVQVDDRVRFAVRETGAGLVIEQLEQLP